MRRRGVTAAVCACMTILAQQHLWACLIVSTDSAEAVVATAHLPLLLWLLPCHPVCAHSLQAAQLREQELAAKRVKRKAKKWLLHSQQQLDKTQQGHVAAAPEGGAAEVVLTAEERKAAKALRRAEAEQRAAEEAQRKEELERRKAEALARLQAAAAASSSQQKQKQQLVKPMRPKLSTATDAVQQQQQQPPQ